MINNQFQHLALQALSQLKSKKDIQYAPNHGSSCGEKVETTVYYDPYRSEWTYKSRAIEGHIFQSIHPDIAKTVNKILKENEQ